MYEASDQFSSGKKRKEGEKQKKVIRNFGGSNEENFPEILAPGRTNLSGYATGPSSPNPLKYALVCIYMRP